MIKMETVKDDKEGLVTTDRTFNPEEAKLQFAWDLVGQAGNVSLDVARSILATFSVETAKARCAGRRRQVGGYIQCPKCGTPWIAGFCRARLVGCPRTARSIRNILKKERKHPKKLSSLERMYLTSFRTKQNIVEVLCLVCKNKMKEPFSASVKEKAVVENKPELVKKKKKKKRSVKEINAGLRLRTSESHPTASKTLKSASSPQKRKSLKNKDTASSDGTSRTVDVEMTGEFPRDKGKKTCFLPRRWTKNSSKCQRKSLVGSPLCGSSGSGTTSVPQKIPTRKEKQERQKKVSQLKTAMIRDVIKERGSSKNDTLGDFLNSLF